VEVDATRSRTLVFSSAAMRHALDQVARVAPTTTSVLITGETGTGKELIARLIHLRSPRAARELVAVDCAALPPSVLESELFGHERGAFTGADRLRLGAFELAHGTTLFIDEIANLSLEAQAKLLRVLQERQFRRVGGSAAIDTNFRLIAASNVDLLPHVRTGAFRTDLYHRLAVYRVSLPSLRERPEDISLLASHFIAEKRTRLNRSNVLRISHEALSALMAYDWPGNVRELENVIEVALIECRGDTIEATHLTGPAQGNAHASSGVPQATYRVARHEALGRFERIYVATQLRHFEGRVAAAAAAAAVTPKHLRTLMRRYGISRRSFRRPPG
jgi:DNA-binding NtrC family response regulator